MGGKRKLDHELASGYEELLKSHVDSLEFVTYDPHGGLDAKRLIAHKPIIQGLRRVGGARHHPTRSNLSGRVRTLFAAR
jgi:hypothetical protein